MATADDQGQPDLTSGHVAHLGDFIGDFHPSTWRQSPQSIPSPGVLPSMSMATPRCRIRSFDAQATQGHARHQHLPALLVTQHRFVHRRRPRSQGNHRGVVRPKRCRQVAGQHLGRSLAGPIGHEQGISLLRGDGGDIDNPALTDLSHFAGCFLARHEHPFGIDVMLPVPMLVGDV
jgi:hypothetical protein